MNKNNEKYENRKNKKCTNEEIVDYYNEGLSPNQIGKKCGCSSQPINRIIRKENVKLRSHRESRVTYKKNINFFDKIDSEEKAYILGFLFADGSNVKGYNNQYNNVSVTQHEKDIDILYKIGNAVFVADFNIKERHPYYTLHITSIPIATQLARLGMIANKTFNLQYPTLDKELNNHFIRGVFDGDGSVWGKIHDPLFGFTGYEDFILTIRKILHDECGFNLNKFRIRHKESPKIGSVSYHGYNLTLTFYNYIYQNSTIFGERKKKTFERLLQL